MTTIALTDVVRIDIMEGPNFEGLIQPWLMLNHFGEDQVLPKLDEINVRFDEVVYLLEDGSKLDPAVMGALSHMKLIGLEPLGGVLKSFRTGDVVITVEALGMTFRGHYNTHKRKGSVSRQRETV